MFSDLLFRAYDGIHYSDKTIVLKAVDTIGICQRLAYTVRVSQHMHKITNL